MHAMRDVKPGDLVKRKTTGEIRAVATSDAGACQVRLVASPLDPKDPEYEAKASHAARNGPAVCAMESWDLFEPYSPEPETQPELPPAAESDPFPKGAA